jgi:Uncharacterized protein conserved in bacteria (DUF2314)
MADGDKPTVYTPNILWLDGADAEMGAAVRDAQRTFGQYRDALTRTPPTVEDCGVKVFVPSQQDPGAGEHMWVKEVAFGQSGMVGTLCNDPGRVRGLRASAAPGSARRLAAAPSIPRQLARASQERVQQRVVAAAVGPVRRLVLILQLQEEHLVPLDPALVLGRGLAALLQGGPGLFVLPKLLDEDGRAPTHVDGAEPG